MRHKCNNFGGNEMKNRSRLYTVVATIVIAATLTAGTSSAATKPATWTITKAQTQVREKVRVPWCRAFAGRPYIEQDCLNGKPISERAKATVSVSIATCRGTGAATGGRYRQFLCDWQANNDIAEGRLQVFVVSASAFRWKSL